MKYLRLLLVVPLFATACVDAQKSANPLSPTIAGPIPGVSITPPAPVAPIDNARIAVGQPITLVLANAETNGVRPLTYVFEVAVDAQFSNKVFQREGVVPGEGRTELRLPDPLAPERTYYWRAQARDGANTGPYSAYGFFRVFTPIVLNAPGLQSPINNVQTGSVQVEFVIGNAGRSGPVGQVAYEINVAENAAFAGAAVWTVSEQPGATRYSPGALSAGRQYFWRARAFEPNTIGPWSETQTFRTPQIVAPSPTPTPPTSCTLPRPTPFESLICLRNAYPHPFGSNAQRVEYLNRVAWAHGLGLHRDSGSTSAPQPRTGIQVSTDLLVEPNGSVYDVLINEEDPTWRYVGPINTMGNYVPAAQP